MGRSWGRRRPPFHSSWHRDPSSLGRNRHKESLGNRRPAAHWGGPKAALETPCLLSTRRDTRAREPFWGAVYRVGSIFRGAAWVQEVQEGVQGPPTHPPPTPAQ